MRTDAHAGGKSSSLGPSQRDQEARVSHRPTLQELLLDHSTTSTSSSSDASPQWAPPRQPDLSKFETDKPIPDLAAQFQDVTYLHMKQDGQTAPYKGVEIEAYRPHRDSRKASGLLDKSSSSSESSTSTSAGRHGIEPASLSAPHKAKEVADKKTTPSAQKNVRKGHR